MLTRIIAGLAIAIAARAAVACSASPLWPETLLENRVISSANGRYLAVDREYAQLPDFTAKPAGEVFPDLLVEMTGAGTEQVDIDTEPSILPTIVALYEAQPKAPRLLAEMQVDRSTRVILVSDSGRIVAITPPEGNGCSAGLEPADPMVIVYFATGQRAGSMTLGSVFSPPDIWRVVSDHQLIEYTLRNESETREVLVLAVAGTERRIDLATMALLDPKTDLFPVPRVSAVPATDALHTPLQAARPDCEAAFGAHDLIRLDSEAFYRRAVVAPLPPFPELMTKARIRGSVLADVLVSEKGEVECVRATSLPFGATQAAIGAAMRWRFEPVRIDGRRVKFAGELLFKFADVDDEDWRNYVATAPPQS
jgi:hypothetical protein